MSKKDQSPAKKPAKEADENVKMPAKKQTFIKYASPSKSGKPPPSPKKRTPMRIVCINFSAVLEFEIYMYEKSQDDDGFTHNISRYIRDEYGDLKCDEFDKCNFTASLVRRAPFSNNAEMKNLGNKYMRHIFIRWPTEGESTPETRQQGMEGLKALINDRRFHAFVPDNIVLEDRTDYDATPPFSMDQFMHNDAIDVALKQAINESEWTRDFRNKYPNLAAVIWRGNYPSDYGKSLGF